MAEVCMVALCATLVQVWVVLHCCLCVCASLEAQFLIYAGVAWIMYIHLCHSIWVQWLHVLLCTTGADCILLLCTCSDYVYGQHEQHAWEPICIWIAPVCEYC